MLLSLLGNVLVYDFNLDLLPIAGVFMYFVSLFLTVIYY